MQRENQICTATQMMARALHKEIREIRKDVPPKQQCIHLSDNHSSLVVLWFCLGCRWSSCSPFFSRIFIVSLWDRWARDVSIYVQRSGTPHSAGVLLSSAADLHLIVWPCSKTQSFPRLSFPLNWHNCIQATVHLRESAIMSCHLKSKVVFYDKWNK